MERQKVVSDTPTLDDLLQLIGRLTGDGGCPWDRKQTPRSLTVYLIEEVYELVEAVLAEDMDAIEEEMGDVLFQIFFLFFLFQQKNRMRLDRVLSKNLSKMIRRHPHVFGTDKVDSTAQVKKRWREIKKAEKNGSGQASVLDTVPSGMSALMRAYRISERAAGTGFEWADLEGVIAQVEAEWAEFKSEIRSSAATGAKASEDAAMEFGDVLFSMVNVARFAHFHPETALSRSTLKFVDRFKRMEAMAADRSESLEQLQRDELEQLWESAKASELEQIKAPKM